MKYAILSITIFSLALIGCGTDTDDPCDLEAEQQFLVDNAQESDVFVTDSGLQYKVLSDNEDGESPTAGSRVRVHFEGRTIDGNVFDSSFGGDPAVFRLNQVISGFSEGIQLMTVGSTYEFYLPGNLAYGNSPPPGSGICRRATLIFIVELLEIL